MQLLPGDKIFVATHTGLSLYDTSSIEATTNIPPASTWPHPWPTWLFELSIYPKASGLSQMYHCNNTNEFRLIFTASGGVYGIIIPCQSSQIESDPKIQVVKLKNIYVIFYWDRTYFGYNSTVMIGKGPALTMLYYSWPEGSSESPCGPSNHLVSAVDEEGWKRPEHSAFDEPSSRVVVESGNKLIVYDFAEFKNVSSMWI